MVANGVEQSLSKSDFHEYRCLENIKKLFKTTGKYEDQQQYKSMIKAALVSTPEGCTNNIPMEPNPYVSNRNNISRRPFRKFTGTLVSNIILLFVGLVHLRQSIRQ